MGQAAQALLQSPQLPAVESILTALINELVTIPRSVALVLDDFHVIESQTVQSAVTFLLDHLPPQMHLILSSRADPQISLARLRARGELVEIRAADLRFGQDEAVAFFSQVMSLSLSSEDIEALEARTEGWIAGLQMVALSMQGREDIHGFIASFSGSHRYVLDFLTDEVFKRQSTETQQFLLQTSILDRMCASLCEAVTGMKDSLTVLETLDRANVFLIPSDDERRWYRYHHLFADLLRVRLQQIQSDQVGELQRRASEWHERQGLIEEAVSYALEAHDVERAATLVEAKAAAMLAQGRAAGLSAWIDALPEKLVLSRPHLGLAHVWALLLELKIDQMQKRLQQIEQTVTSDTDLAISGEIALLCGVVADTHGNNEGSLVALQELLQKLPPENAFLRGRAWMYLGFSYMDTDPGQATHALDQSRMLNVAAGDVQGALAAAYQLSTMQIARGELSEAATTCREALQLAERTPHWPAAGYAHIGMGELLYEWNELDDAAKHLQEAVDLAELGAHSDVLLSAALALARLHRARSEWEEARQWLDRCAQILQRVPSAALAEAQITEEWVRLWLAEDKVSEAVQRVRETDLSTEGSLTSTRALNQLNWARASIAGQQAHSIVPLLAWLAEKLEGVRVLWWVIQALSLQALALRASGLTEQAWAVLVRGLLLAKSKGYVRTLLDEGEAMRSLIAELAPWIEKQSASSGGSEMQGLLTYIDRLLAAFPNSSPQIEKPKFQNLVVPLSQRELEVLRLVAGGKSNQEIAEDLTLAVGTVKKHINNIFGKLSVESRTQAIVRGQELNLL